MDSRGRAPRGALPSPHDSRRQDRRHAGLPVTSRSRTLRRAPLGLHSRCEARGSGAWCPVARARCVLGRTRERPRTRGILGALVVPDPACGHRAGHLRDARGSPASPRLLAPAASVITTATITCPECGFAKTESMPTNACRHFYRCDACQALLKPRPGDCCVFCSYSDQLCPPKQSDLPS